MSSQIGGAFYLMLGISGAVRPLFNCTSNCIVGVLHVTFRFAVSEYEGISLVKTVINLILPYWGSAEAERRRRVEARNNYEGAVLTGLPLGSSPHRPAKV